MESKGLWIGIAIVALIAGLGIGFMIGRKRKMPTKSSTTVSDGKTATPTKTATVEKQPTDAEKEVIKTK